MKAVDRFISELTNLMGVGLSGAFGAALNYSAKFKAQGAVVAKTVAATLTPVELLSGILTGTHAVGGTVAYTLPTGALLDAALADQGFDVNEGFEWSLINLSAAALDTITITAGADHTIVGNPIVTSSHTTTVATSSARFFTRKSAAGVFVTYRIS